MTDKQPKTRTEHLKVKKDQRQKRLNQALRDNLKRRKAQTRKAKTTNEVEE
jgi:hypothetical protein